VLGRRPNLRLRQEPHLPQRSNKSLPVEMVGANQAKDTDEERARRPLAAKQMARFTPGIRQNGDDLTQHHLPISPRHNSLYISSHSLFFPRLGCFFSRVDFALSLCHPLLDTSLLGPRIRRSHIHLLGDSRIFQRLGQLLQVHDLGVDTPSRGSLIRPTHLHLVDDSERFQGPGSLPHLHVLGLEIHPRVAARRLSVVQSARVHIRHPRPIRLITRCFQTLRSRGQDHRLLVLRILGPTPSALAPPHLQPKPSACRKS